jgi:hypothetical protein
MSQSYFIYCVLAYHVSLEEEATLFDQIIGSGGNVKERKQ